MIPPPFDYAAPKTLSEAVALLGKNPEAKILSGGHSLLPMMKFRPRIPVLAGGYQPGGWSELHT